MAQVTKETMIGEFVESLQHIVQTAFHADIQIVHTGLF